VIITSYSSHYCTHLDDTPIFVLAICLGYATSEPESLDDDHHARCLQYNQHDSILYVVH